LKRWSKVANPSELSVVALTRRIKLPQMWNAQAKVLGIN
jgi:hypothetical protein